MMNEKKGLSLHFMIAIGAIAFVAYNAALFALCGFRDHGGAFWSSYAFMVVASIVVFCSILLLRQRSIQPKDWLLGYPVLKHCAIYLLLEFIASTLFVIADYFNCPWGISFAVQMILLAVHLVFAISCFMAKDIIETTEEKVKQKTSYIRMLQVDAEILVESMLDAELKKIYAALAEQIRYSDPVSSEELEELEMEILGMMKHAKLTTDREELLHLCQSMSLLVAERNKKCKALK